MGVNPLLIVLMLVIPYSSLLLTIINHSNPLQKKKNIEIGWSPIAEASQVDHRCDFAEDHRNPPRRSSLKWPGRRMARAKLRRPTPVGLWVSIWWIRGTFHGFWMILANSREFPWIFDVFLVGVSLDFRCFFLWFILLIMVDHAYSWLNMLDHHNSAVPNIRRKVPCLRK